MKTEELADMASVLTSWAEIVEWEECEQAAQATADGSPSPQNLYDAEAEAH